MSQQPVLISSSKDTYVKFWDLDSRHCFKTLVGHHTEVCASFDLFCVNRVIFNVRKGWFLLGCFKSFVRFYESILNCNISVNSFSI